MSHITELKTKLNSLPHIFEALKELNLSFKYKENYQYTLRAYGNNKTKVDILIETQKSGSRFNVGLIKQEDSTFKLIGDFMGFRVMHQGDFLNQETFARTLNQLQDVYKTEEALRNRKYSFNRTYDKKTRSYKIKFTNNSLRRVQYGRR